MEVSDLSESDSSSKSSDKTEEEEDALANDWRGVAIVVTEVKKVEFAATWRDSDIVRNPKYQRKKSDVGLGDLSVNEAKRSKYTTKLMQCMQEIT